MTSNWLLPAIAFVILLCLVLEPQYSGASIGNRGVVECRSSVQCGDIRPVGVRAEQQFAGDDKVIAIRQIHEQLADVIQVPEELRNRRTEVIFLAIDTAESHDASGQRQEETQDFAADLFFGALPDFPERAPQGDFETRLELP